jgi:uncharacterized protein (DUF2236 family)
MTIPDAGQYATAAGLIERSAAAYVSGVPERPADDGFFGPASVTWKISGDVTGPVAGLRSLMVQALHPLAMAGVDQHSGWREDPVGRLAATSAYVTTISFGERAAAERAAARVRRIHTRVTGVDEVTGHRYEASDPALLLWVHAALVESTVTVRRLLGTPLAAEDADRYVAEMVVAAELVGIPAGMVPAGMAELDAYIAYLLDPPGLDEEIADIWQDVRYGAVVSLPDWAREMYGYTAEPLTPERREEVRQVLGVLDAVFIGEPGVLEARQRITALMRAARPA